MFQLSLLERKGPCPPFLGSGARDMQQSLGESELILFILTHCLPRRLGRIEPLGDLNVNFCCCHKTYSFGILHGSSFYYY
jgi:hypothetical protein